MRGKLELDKYSFKSFLSDREIHFSGNLNLIEQIVNVKPIKEALNTDISFCRFEGNQGIELVNKSSAGLIFLPHSLLEHVENQNSILIPCSFPRLEMLKFLSKFWNEPYLDDGYVSNKNITIHETASIGPDVRIGQYTVIGPGVKIKKGARIGTNIHIENAEIGMNARIASNVTIGGTGFGFEDDPTSGEMLEFPHIGGVKIGNNVSIGSCTCIDRGSLGDTIIGNNVKMDNLVHIAHNVKIGNNCKIIALSFVGGSAEIGENCWISPSSSIRDWRKVGKGALVGLGAIVTKDVDPNNIVIGNPAKPIQKKLDRYK